VFDLLNLFYRFSINPLGLTGQFRSLFSFQRTMFFSTTFVILAHPLFRCKLYFSACFELQKLSTGLSFACLANRVSLGRN
ncbi:hypothetical protein, partial [Paenibacillus sp. NPDC058071]|uniref:hypothetical protein n=1 Tax=Paenibacillus sp. NPDC058071 TaxID=3346326 RepID=UPI0036D7D9D9